MKGADDEVEMKALLILISAICGLSALGQEPKVAPTPLRTYLADSEWTCRYTEKYVVNQGSEKAPKGLHGACFARVRCDKGGSWRGFALACTAPAADTCPSIATCEEENRGDKGKTSYRSGELSDKAEKADTAKDKDGRSCKYGFPESKAIYRTVGKTEDAVCATPINCTNPTGVSARRGVVVCQAVSTREVEGKLKATCPRVNDCLDTEIVPRQGYTAEELAALRASGGVQQKQSDEYSFGGDAPFTHPSD